MEPQLSRIEGDGYGPPQVDGNSAERREHYRHLTVMRVAKLVNEALQIEGLGVVRNVSDGGMMIEAHIAVEVGQVIAVSLLEDRKVLGEITWKEGNAIGISFDAPVPIEDVLARPDRLGDGRKVRLPRLQVTAQVRRRVRLARFRSEYATSPNAAQSWKANIVLPSANRYWSRATDRKCAAP